MGDYVSIRSTQPRYFGVLCALLLALGLAGAQHIPNPFAANDISSTVLPNGLRLIVREEHSLPLVAMVVVVRGGSSAEMNTRGIAHFLEHLVFQGTKRYPGALAPQFALEEVGGLSNAVTTRDVNRFQAIVAANQVDLLVNVLADITLAPTLSKDSFENERPTILAEIQRELDNPLALLVNRAYALTYRLHPYRNSPHGTVDEVLRLTVDDVRAFHKRWYVPNNMSVVLVGDITAKRANELVRQAFGTTALAKVPEWPKPDPEAPKTFVREHLERGADETYQVMVYPAPGSKDLSSMVMTDLVLTMLIDGRDALLPAQWARDGIPVTNYGGEYVSSREPGRFILWAQTSPAMAERLRLSTQAYLRNLAIAAPTPATLLRARQRLAAQFLTENETYSQQAATMAFYEGLGGAKLVSRYIPVLEAATVEQVRAAIPTTMLGWVTAGQRPEEEN